MAKNRRIGQEDERMISLKAREKIAEKLGVKRFSQARYGALIGRNSSVIYKRENALLEVPTDAVIFASLVLRLLELVDVNVILSELEAIEEDRRSEGSAIAALIDIAYAHGHPTLAREVSGRVKTIAQEEDAEVGDGPVNIMKNVSTYLDDMRDVIRRRASSKDPRVQEAYEKALLSFSNSIELVKLAGQIEGDVIAEQRAKKPPKDES